MILAHGVGGRADLPLPAWLFAYGAGFAVVISFVALGILWPRPRLAKAAIGRDVPAVARVEVVATYALRAIGLFAFGIMLVAALWGVDNDVSNIAPYALYVAFWVGIQLVSFLFGDVWAALNPLDTLSYIVLGRRLPERTSRADPGLWPAAAMIASFAWLELCYHAPSSPRSIAVWLVAYTVAALAGAAWWGRRWLGEGEGFAALFGLIARMAPIYRDSQTSQLRARWPFSGLASLVPRRGLAALVLVALGSTTFDGVQRTDWWAEVLGTRRGWSATLVNSLGLAFVVSAVALAWFGATRISARITNDDPAEVDDAYVSSLVPIVLAYSVAHYFSFFVFEMYNVVALASDPFGRGWDVFGTIDVTTNYSALSPDLIAWVQAAAIVVGHVAGVAVAHDRAVERHKARLARRSQYPLVGAMVAYTVVGLLLLLNA